MAGTMCISAQFYFLIFHLCQIYSPFMCNIVSPEELLVTLMGEN